MTNSGIQALFQRQWDEAYPTAYSRPPINTVWATVLVRQQGAQGSFYPINIMTRAEEDKIIEYITDDCSVLGLEVGGISKVWRITKAWQEKEKTNVKSD